MLATSRSHRAYAGLRGSFWIPTWAWDPHGKTIDKLFRERRLVKAPIKRNSGVEIVDVRENGKVAIPLNEILLDQSVIDQVAKTISSVRIAALNFGPVATSTCDDIYSEGGSFSTKAFLSEASKAKIHNALGIAPLPVDTAITVEDGNIYFLIGWDRTLNHLRGRN